MFSQDDWNTVADLVDRKEKEITEDVKRTYVSSTQCSENRTKLTEKISHESERLSIIEAKFGIIEKFLWIIATTGVGSLLTGILQLIFK